MITQDSLAAANNTAVLANITEICAHSISEVLGNDSSNIVEGKAMTVSHLRELVVARLSANITEMNGG